MFLDRDGVINRKIEGGYVRTWDDFQWLPNIADWIRLLNALDLLVIVVTNQRGVSLGQVLEADLEEVHRRMIAELARQDARIDDVLYCPHARDSCDCRKPKPGMIYRARDKWDIDLGASLMIGDSDCDAELAAACGLRFLRVEYGRLLPPSPRGI